MLTTMLKKAVLGTPGASRLARRLDALAGGPANRVFYLAIKPALILPSVQNLRDAGLLDQSDSLKRRVVVEKPFGIDLASAQELNRDLLQLIGEDQLYRIDHYLGKETVQNLLVFRFRNAFFEPLWNQKYIELVQITVADVRDGACSSSTLQEAASWGKVNTGIEQMVFAEAGSVMPLLASDAYHRGLWKDRPTRAWAKLFA